MEKPISKGDLVQVVRPSTCTGDATEIGNIFRVVDIERGEVLKGMCFHCRKHHKDVGLWAMEDRGPRYWWPFYRLKRIPPLEELEGVLAQREITEPLTGKKVIA